MNWRMCDVFPELVMIFKCKTLAKVTSDIE